LRPVGSARFFVAIRRLADRYLARTYRLVRAGRPNLKINEMKGFTLIEVILVVALVIAVAAVALPSPARFVFSQQVDVVVDELSGSFRKAQSYSMAGKVGSSWGVSVRDGRIILFQGSSYAGRDAAYDESYAIPQRVEVSGVDEVIFTGPSGRPLTTPEISIAWKDANWLYVLNAEGVFEER
jgi:type II secretory pathway pseudopilin PulG